MRFPSAVSLALALAACASPAAAPSTDTDATSTGTDTDASSSGGPTCAQTIYVNFDGATLSQWDMPEQAAVNRVTSSTLAREFAPYSGLDRAEVLGLIEGHWAPFSVCITGVRPDSFEYSMVIITDTDVGGGLKALTASDCGNENPNNISVVFALPAWATSAHAVANVASANLAAAFGVDFHADDVADLACHVDGPPCDDYGSPRSFVDECLDLGSTNFCRDQHLEHCEAGQQNSFQDLIAVLGPAQ